MLERNKKYYLLENGRVYVNFKEIDEKFIRDDNDAIAVIEFDERGWLAVKWERVIFATDNLVDLEHAEWNYFNDSWAKLNWFFKMLTGRRHSYRLGGSDRYDLIDKLIDLNRVSIVKQMQKEECR